MELSYSWWMEDDFYWTTSEGRAKACFRMTERGGTKKGLIPRGFAAERRRRRRVQGSALRY